MGSPGGHFAFDVGFSQGNLDHTTIAALNRKQQKQKKRLRLVEGGVGGTAGRPSALADGSERRHHMSAVEGRGEKGIEDGGVDEQGQRRPQPLELNDPPSSVTDLVMDNSALPTPSRPGSAPSNLESTLSFSKKPKSRSVTALQHLRDLRASSPDPLLAHGFSRSQAKQGLGQGSGPGSYDGVHSTLASNNNVNSFGLSTVTRDLPWGPKEKRQSDKVKGLSNAHHQQSRSPGTPGTPHLSTQPQAQSGGLSPSMNTFPSSTSLPPPTLAELNVDPRLDTLAKDLTPLHFETGHQPSFRPSHQHIPSAHSFRPSHQHIPSTQPINTYYQHTLSTHPINPHYQRIPSTRPIITFYSHNSPSLLHLDTELNFADYETYCTILGKISLSSRTDPVPLLELSQWLLTAGLGVESIAVLNNALEILNGEDRPIPISDLIVAQIVLTKLSTKYFGRFGKFKAFRALLDCALDSPDVVGIAAGYMHHLQYTQQAEDLYLGALVLDPAYATALQGYARILVDKGLYHAAHRCLSRVPDHRYVRQTVLVITC